MHIYLRHPQYGTKVATVEQEAVEDEVNGWERFDPIPVVEEVPETVETKKKSKDNTPSFLE